MNSKTVTCFLASVLIAGEAFALDAACLPMLSASEARIKQSAWHGITVVNGNFRMETIKVGGGFFRQIGGSWSRSPVNFDEAERAMIAQMRSDEIKLSQCSSGGGDSVDGVPVYLFKSRIEMKGAPAEDSTLFIGKADGLPYRQVSKSVNVVYKYKDVVPPKI